MGRLSRAAGAARASHLLTGGAPLLVAGMTTVNLANLVFHVVVSRNLGPSSYGALGALLSIVLVLTVPVGALQAVITREVAARRATTGPGVVPLVVGPLLAEAIVWGAGVAVVLGLASPLMRTFLHLPSLSAALLLSAYVVPVAIGLVPKAVLLGEQRFGRVALALVAGATVRLAAGMALVEAGAGINGALGASVFAAVLEAAILLPGLRSMVGAPGGPDPLRVRWSDTSTALVAMVGFWLLTGAGVLVARHYLPRVESGFYAASWTAATGAMFLPGAVSLVAFPRFVAARSVPAARALLVRTLAVVGVLAFGAAAVTILASGVVVRILFGSAFEASSTLVAVLSVAAAFLAVTSTLMYFHLGRDNVGPASLSWVGTIGVVAAGGFVHSSPSAIGVVVLAATGAVVVSMLWAALRPRPEIAIPESAMGRELWNLPEPDVDVTIVVPFYNPGPRFQPNMQRLLDVLSSSGSTFEVVAVSDGCTDGSERALHDLDARFLRHVILERNMGKGQALKVGLAMGRGRYIGFIDADGDLDPALLRPLLSLVATYHPDVVLGSKRHPMSEVDYPALRRIYSWGYQQLIRVLFRLNVRDTQTGLKLVRREVLAEALPRMVEKRFAFDLELFVVARRLGWTKFFEAPVAIEERFVSTVSMRTVWPMLVDTLAIFYRLRILGFYGGPGRVRRTPPSQEPRLPAESLLS